MDFYEEASEVKQKKDATKIIVTAKKEKRVDL